MAGTSRGVARLVVHMLTTLGTRNPGSLGAGTELGGVAVAASHSAVEADSGQRDEKA